MSPACFATRMSSMLVELTSSRGHAPAPAVPQTASALRSAQQPGAAALHVVKHSLQSRSTARSSRMRAIAFSSVDAPAPPFKTPRTETVADVMTRGEIFCVRPETTVDEALELLVSKAVTGMPVLDEDGKVVGVVSDYDLLSLEGIAEKAQDGQHMFPELSMEWNTFREVQRAISKNAGKTVADVMTEEPLVVRPETNMAAAAKILLDQKVRRLPVVDDAGRLVGIFTRRDVVKAALATRKAAAGL